MRVIKDVISTIKDIKRIKNKIITIKAKSLFIELDRLRDLYIKLNLLIDLKELASIIKSSLKISITRLKRITINIEDKELINFYEESLRFFN